MRTCVYVTNRSARAITGLYYSARDDGSHAIGTILDPRGKVIEFINRNEAFYGEATILGKHYLTGYEPMHDEQNNVIGIYFLAIW
jgi:hypothetical protein